MSEEQDWRDKMKRRIKDRQEGNTHKINVGDNCFRFMPDKKDISPEGKFLGVRHDPTRMFRTHRHVGPDDAWGIACGVDVDGNGTCWLCEQIEKDAAGRDPKLRIMAENMTPQDNFVVNASRYDRQTKQFSVVKPVYLSTGGKNPLADRVGSKLAYVGERKSYIDPVKGYNINISREGTGFRGKDATRYPDVDGDEYPTTVPPQVLLTVKDLDTLIPHYDEEEQKRAYYGEKAEEGADRGRGRERERDRGERRRPADHDDDFGSDAPSTSDDPPQEYGESEPPLDDAPLPDEPPLGDEPPLDDDLPPEPPEDEPLPEPPFDDEIEPPLDDELPPEPPPPPAPRRTAPAPARQAAPAKQQQLIPAQKPAQIGRAHV